MIILLYLLLYYYFIYHPYCSYFRGLGHIREYLALFVMTWLCLAPIIAFQALLSAYDDYMYGFYGSENRHNGPTATEVAVPILVVLGWLWLAVTTVSWKMQTAYQV